MFSSESEAQLARYGLVCGMVLDLNDVMSCGVNGVMRELFNGFICILIHFSTHFSSSSEGSFGGEAVGNSVGEETLSHEHHGLVEVALLALQSRRNLFASTEPVSQSSKSSCGDVWVAGLLPSVHGVVAGDTVFIVLGPGLVEIAVDLKRLLVGDVEVAAPASKGLATGVGVIPVGLRADSLGYIPVYRQVYDRVVVHLAKASGFEPLGVDSLLSGLQHARVELDARQRTVGVPLDGHGRVPVLSNHFAEVLGR